MSNEPKHRGTTRMPAQHIQLFQTVSSARAQPAHDLPPIPPHFVDEANELINVQCNRPGPLLQKMQLVYAFLDRVNQYVATFVTCSKACSHCCHMDIQLTLFEAEYLSVATDVPLRHQAPLTTGHEGACPFLSDHGTCSVYMHRPLFCRTYHSLSDPRLCATPGAAVRQYGSQESNMGNPLFLGAKSWIYFQNQQITGGVVRDIRDFFPHSRQDIQMHMQRAR